MTDSVHHTPLMLEHLRTTRPWVLFLSILGFIGGGIMVLFALILLLTGVIAHDGSNVALSIIGSAFYGLTGVFYGFFAYLLFRYSSSIGQASVTDQAEDLELAVEQQRVFWKATGIATIATLVLSSVGTVLAIVFFAVYAANAGSF